MFANVDLPLRSVPWWVAQRIEHATACNGPKPKVITSASTRRRNAVLHLMPISLSLEYILTKWRFKETSATQQSR
jgi:hypothetical protein